MNLLIAEFVRDLDVMATWINFGVTFWAFGSVLFFITLAYRGLFVYKESYKFTLRMTIVFVAFGGELALSYFPDLFFIHMANIVFALSSAILGMYLAEAWAIHQHEKIRSLHLPDSIFERYKETHMVDNGIVTAED